MSDEERIATLKAERDRALARAYQLALAYLQSLDERHVGPRTDARGIRDRLRTELTDGGEDAESVVADMATALAIRQARTSGSSDLRPTMTYSASG